MFKGFQSIGRQFNSVPDLNFQMNNEAYGFSGCTFWLDAAYGLNTQTDLAAVTLWKNKISNVSLTQNTVSLQPRLILSDPSFNNNPVIDFNTTGRGLNLDYPIAINLRNQTTVLVYQYISAAIGSNFSSRLLSDGQTAFGVGQGYWWNRRFNSSTNSQSGFYLSVNNNSSNSALSSNLFSSSVYIVIFNSQKWYANGSDVVISSGSLSNIVSFNFNTLGGDSTATSGIFKMSEMLIYNKILSSSDFDILSNRLNTKYAVY